MTTDIVGSRTLRSQWDETAKFYADTTFLTYVSVEHRTTAFTYREFDHLVKQTANFFLSLGVQKQELIALHLHNTPEYLICWLALAQYRCGIRTFKRALPLGGKFLYSQKM